MKFENIFKLKKVYSDKFYINKYIEYAFLISLKKDNNKFTLNKIFDLNESSIIKNHANKITISKEIIYKFLIYCHNNKLIPMFTHNHPCYLAYEITFSEKDMIFNDAILKVGRQIGIDEFIFFVTNLKKSSLKYYKGEVCINRKGDFYDVFKW